MKKITLDRDEHIIAVVPEHCNGPGWSNTVLWVYIGNNDGKYRTESYQPDERSYEIETLFPHAALMHDAMVRMIPMGRKK